jgi:ferredoxin-NADP reductase
VTGAPTPVRWRLGAVLEVIEETPHAKTIVFEVPDWPGHVAGQHVDIRLTAEDGYQTERTYSIGSPPEQSTVELTVERIDDGEVSPCLTEELRAGDELELRGPIGGYFNWRNEDGGPLLLIAGGSGLVPLMAMLRHRAASASTVDARLLLSARSLEDVLYREELGELAAGDGLTAHYTLTREPPPDWEGVCSADRCGDVDDGRTGSGARAADLRVRAERVRRAGGQSPPGAGSRADRDPH